MVTGVSNLRGVTAEIAASLHALGIYDSEQLLAATGSPAARAELAELLGIDTCQVLEIANRADLARICNLTATYKELLACAGVDTVMELGRRIPENLYAKLLVVAAQHHVQQIPRLDEVQRWVHEAKELGRVVYY